MKTNGARVVSIDSEFSQNFQPNLPKNFAWQSDALCAETDPEMFFPEKGGSTRDAKKICAQCDVGRECLQHALDTHQRGGIAGGLSDGERRNLLGKTRDEIDRIFEANRRKNR